MEQSEQLEQINATLTQMNDTMEKLTSAFPKDADGNIDAEGHRRYHEALIRSAELQEAFWRDLRYDLIRKGLWAVIIVVCGLVITGMSVKLGFK